MLNESKTKCVLFRAAGFQTNVAGNITLGPYSITVEKHVKTLGVIFSENMSWNEHINAMCTKNRKSVGVLNRTRHSLPVAIKKLIYHSLFHSHLCYCVSVWGNTTSQNLHKLTILQKKAVRAIQNAHFLEHTEGFFQTLKILKVADVYNNKLLRCYKSAVHGKLDSFLPNANLKRSHYVYPYRHQPPWQIPFSRTEYGRQRASCTLPKLINYFDQLGIDVFTLNNRRLTELFL